MSTATHAASLRPPESRIAEALVRLNRAVQRASIYPAGHPAIGAGVKAFIESLPEALAERAVLRVGVAADLLVVEGVSLDERRAALSWLTEQLRDRGIASFAIDREAAEPDLVRFVDWLAHPPAAGSAAGSHSDEGLTFPGISLTRIDYGRARFVEAASARTSDPARVWETLASSLTAGWYFDDQPLPEEPEALARELSAHVLRNEELGAATLLARIEATGAHLAQLPDSLRAAIKRRLAAFVAGLTPDLRSQLLRIDQDTSRLKVEFLAEVMDGLSDTLIMEVLADIDLGGGPPPRHLLNLFSKLIGVAAIEPASRELAEAKFQSLGLPPGLTEIPPAQVESALREVFDAQDDYANPATYQARLDTLSREGPGDTMLYESRHYRDPSAVDEVRAHVSSIVLRLLLADPDRPEAPDQARRLLADLPGDVAAHRFDAIHERATALREILARPGGVAEELRREIAAYLARVAEPGFVAALLVAEEQNPGAFHPGVIGLFRAAGVDAACAAFDRLAEMPAGEGQERLGELLFLLEPEAFNAAVARLRSAGSPSLRVLFPLLRRPGAPPGVDLVLTFVANKDPAIRLEAFRFLLAADEASGQFPRLLGKALADPSADIVALGLERSPAIGGPSTVKALGEFLGAWLVGGLPLELGRRAALALASLPGTEGRDVLRSLLSNRKLSLSIAAVRRSMVLEAGLLRVGDDEAVAAVRSFRRSPAGWVSMLLPEPEESEP
jgi:hypothetical protein